MPPFGRRHFCAAVACLVVVLAAILVHEQLLVSDLLPLGIAASLHGRNRTAPLALRAAHAAVHHRNNTQGGSVAPSSQPPFHDKDPSPRGFHFCRCESIRFPEPSNFSEAWRRNSTIGILYQCRGDAYDRFAENMSSYVLRRHSASQNRSLWGRRDFPLPENATILAVGNSHTRQTVYALICQYAHRIARVQRFDFPDAPIDEFAFANGASLVFTANSPLVYSASWHELIRKYDPIHRRLSAYDAIVLGAFNRYNGKSTTNFHQQMMSFQERFPDEVQYTTVPPPTLSSVARQFPKPIVALPMFAEYGLGWERSCNATRSKLTPSSRRSSVVVLHSRAHIEALHHECGSDGMSDVGLCWNKGESSPYGRRPSDMHRCTGPRGGHPDLLAWDVVEALHRLLLPPGR